jgi:hypothetical protein
MIHADMASHVAAGPRPVSQIPGCTDTKHVAGAIIVRPCVLMVCLELNIYGICLTGCRPNLSRRQTGYVIYICMWRLCKSVWHQYAAYETVVDFLHLCCDSWNRHAKRKVAGAYRQSGLPCRYIIMLKHAAMEV